MFGHRRAGSTMHVVAARDGAPSHQLIPKTATRARGKSKFAKHHHSSTSKRIAGLIRAGSDRKARVLDYRSV